MSSLVLMAAASLMNSLPATDDCTALAKDPAAALAYSSGLQGFVYGYPIVDMLKQKHNETHRVAADQPIVAPVNTMVPYPHILTPETQGQLRAPNADTLYVNAWLDLSKGPVLIETPEMNGRYYTLAFMDLFGRPFHLGTRTNQGRATRYAIIGPSGGQVPDGYEAFPVPTDTAWMLGRILADGKADEQQAIAIARSFKMTGPASFSSTITDAAPMAPYASLDFFAQLNGALKSIALPAEEAALMAVFDKAGFGPKARFDAAKLSAGQKLGLGCAIRMGPDILAAQGFKPTWMVNGWMRNDKVDKPGNDYLLRAEIARGGYVNAQEESIYPAAVTDSTGAMLNGAKRYRIRFAPGQTPPVNAFWSITAYDLKTAHLVPNPIRRYQFGDRTKGAKRDADGGLTIYLSAKRPPQGKSNWLPTPYGAYHLVMRMYLPKPEALDGRYAPPPIEPISAPTPVAETKK
ncbi:MAG: hypothetical protein RLZ59_1634 [Pseudomonadota bacterium]|jgi:hypothetical protein